MLRASLVVIARSPSIFSTNISNFSSILTNESAFSFSIDIPFEFIGKNYDNIHRLQIIPILLCN